MARSILLVGICIAIVACHSDSQSIVEQSDSVEAPTNVVPVSSPSTSLDPSFAQLQTLLAAQNWQAADQQTRLLMLKLSGRELEGWMDEQSLDRIGCDHLTAIDRAWAEASGDKFGFSVQRRIWQEAGENLEAMSDHVGWRQAGDWVPSESLRFDLRAPAGHLPSGDGVGLWRDGMRVGRGFPLLEVALRQCGI